MDQIYMQLLHQGFIATFIILVSGIFWLFYIIYTLMLVYIYPVYVHIHGSQSFLFALTSCKNAFRLYTVLNVPMSFHTAPIRQTAKLWQWRKWHEFECDLCCKFFFCDEAEKAVQHAGEESAEPFFLKCCLVNYRDFSQVEAAVFFLFF